MRTNERTIYLISVRVFNIMSRIIGDVVAFGNFGLFIDVNQNWNKIGLDIFFDVGFAINVLPHI